MQCKGMSDSYSLDLLSDQLYIYTDIHSAICRL